MQKFAKRFSYLIVLLTASYLCSCASVNTNEIADSDPWEAWNKPATAFNDKVDYYVLKPIAAGYDKLIPDVGGRAVSRFFSNIGEVTNTVNHLLQGKPSQAANSTGRFLLNSTLGIVGVFEVAETMGLKKQDSEDFGQTLGVWGVGPGPYLVLPFFGPSNLRDAPSRVVDWYTTPTTYLSNDVARFGLAAGDLVDTRTGLFEAERLISGDRYIFIRDAYMQRRQFLINDGEIELEDGFDDFLDDDF